MARKTQPTGLRSALILLSLFLGALSVGAEDLEYEMELGGSLGTSFYLGDVNSTPFAHLSGMGGIVARRVFNPRMALKGNLSVAHLSGKSDGYFIPSDPNSGTAAGGEAVNVSFKRNVIDLGAQFEMNFWGYGMGHTYKNHSRITPYALAGMGLTLAPGGAETAFALNLPVGVGVKYKVRPRLNIGLEWTMRFTTSDALDAGSKEMSQLIHPYGIKSVGLKNKDCYSFTMVFVTYDLCPKYRKCNND
ncbi:MAG: DUF6089 family protein [Bacteroidaceae bacterium]|nr:DUF6089 family protein [Bacteroidaceae bacterium]